MGKRLDETGLTGVEINIATKKLLIETKEIMIDKAPMPEKRLVEKYGYDSILWIVLNDWIKNQGGENEKENNESD